ncbi:MAG: hypothetical protein PVSMB9_09540 [Candidatus Dormibacteria bacterium]
MKRLAALMASGAMALAIGGISVAAASNTDSCNSAHGAFGAFSHHFAANGGVNWISAGAREEGGMGQATGPNNSGFSEVCNG